MTERRQRRSRRRDTAPAPTLPRPKARDASRKPIMASAAPAYRPGREHHVTADYRYVRDDLVGVGIVGTLTLGFVIAMAFIL